MELTVVGANPEMLPILERLRQNPQFQVRMWGGASAECESKLRSFFPDARQLVQVTPSELTLGSHVVLVGGGFPYVWEDTVRELARQGVPLIVMHPGCSAIMALELDMIQQDTGALLAPLHLPALHPGWRTLAEWIQLPEQSPWGRIEQLEWLRRGSDRSEATVRTRLAQDGLLLRQLLGKFEQVNGMAPVSSDSKLAQLDVRITGSGQVLACWRMERDDSRTGIELSLVGNRGRLTIEIPDEGPWRIPETPLGSDDGILPLTSAMESASESASIDLFFRQTSEGEFWPNWEDACRSLELVDLAEESARRGKSLSVNNERITEQDTFHGMMAAGGCLLLLGTLSVLLFVTILDSFRFPFRDWRIWRSWPVGLLGILGVFLVLQLLKLTFRPAEDRP